jgi:hypothetical protein
MTAFVASRRISIFTRPNAPDPQLLIRPGLVWRAFLSLEDEKV